MKKKKILVICNSLKVGGAEKSCISFLKTLPKDKYAVDLMLLSCTGIFLKQLPAWVNLIQAPYSYSCLVHKPQEWHFYIKQNPVVWINKIIRSWRAKHQSQLHIVQAVYRQWREHLPTMEKEYDAAIGYLEGFCNYLVLDDVHARRKIIWIHNNYDNLGYNPSFDFEYFAKADIIATISPKAQENLQRKFPVLADRIRFIENITNAETVKEMAKENISEDTFDTFDGLKIVSCGRLNMQKSFDHAIIAASLLKKEKIPFKWIIIGEGPEHKKLTRLKREIGIDNELTFVGIRENPYPYMKQADMLVVTSRYEGRSVVIDEAKILGIPVITTDYLTATDAVEHEKTGLICSMTPEAIALAIIRLYTDKHLYKHIRQKLSETDFSNTEEITKYIAAIEGEKQPQFEQTKI